MCAPSVHAAGPCGRQMLWCALHWFCPYRRHVLTDAIVRKNATPDTRFQTFLFSVTLAAHAVCVRRLTATTTITCSTVLRFSHSLMPDMAKPPCFPPRRHQCCLRCSCARASQCAFRYSLKPRSPQRACQLGPRLCMLPQSSLRPQGAQPTSRRWQQEAARRHCPGSAPRWGKLQFSSTILMRWIADRQVLEEAVGIYEYPAHDSS